MPGIVKRGNSYRITVSLGYDGKKQIRKCTSFTPPPGTNEKRALKLATDFAYEFESNCRNNAYSCSEMKVRDLCEWYLTKIAPNTLKEKTLDRTEKMISLYVLPYIGDIYVEELTTIKIDDYFQQLHTHGRIRKLYHLKDEDSLKQINKSQLARDADISNKTIWSLGHGARIEGRTARAICDSLSVELDDYFVEDSVFGEGLNSATIARIRTVLSSMFATAVKKEMLSKNPVKFSTVPKEHEKDKEFLTPEQCKLILNSLDYFTNPQLGRVVKVLLYTGMRCGELLALKWSDLDFNNKTIKINKTVYRLNKEYKEGSPKTSSSERTIVMPDSIVDVLKEQKSFQEQLKLECGDKWVDRGTVFTGYTGDYMSSSYLNITFKTFMKDHGMSQMHVHDLRHANASILINAGLPVKLISDHLGHSNTATTENVYAHIFKETKNAAADIISTTLGDKLM